MWGMIRLDVAVMHVTGVAKEDRRTNCTRKRKNFAAEVVDMLENSIKLRCWVVKTRDGWAAEAVMCGGRVFNFTWSLYFSLKGVYARRSHFKCNNKVWFLLPDILSAALIKWLEIVRWIHYCARAHAALFFMSPQERRCIPNFVARISLLMSARAPVVFICSLVVAVGLQRSLKAFRTCTALCRCRLASHHVSRGVHGAIFESIFQAFSCGKWAGHR